MKKTFLDRMPGWPNERGWLTIALFIQTAALIALITWKEDLRKDEFFKAIANAIIVTGWIGFAVGQRGDAASREQVGEAIKAVNETAKSIPNAPAIATETDPVKAANSVAGAAADQAHRIAEES